MTNCLVAGIREQEGPGGLLPGPSRMMVPPRRLSSWNPPLKPTPSEKFAKDNIRYRLNFIIIVWWVLPSFVYDKNEVLWKDCREHMKATLFSL